MIVKTNIKYDIAKARKEAYSILDRQKMSVKDLMNEARGHQLSLTHRKGVTGEARLKDGIHALWSASLKKRIAFEREFTEFHSGLKKTYLHQIYCDLQKRNNSRVGRFRLMWVHPKNCYKFHRDKNEPERFHLALETNPYCFFLYEDSMNDFKVCHIPPDGHLYSFNAGRAHTFLNAGSATRLHLLVTLKT